MAAAGAGDESKGYAIGLLSAVELGPGIRNYLERIDATLDPYNGRFVVHGAAAQVVEGEDPGAVIVIEFPSIEGAREWYGSDAYQRILPLRTDNADGTVVLVAGVGAGHVATDVLPDPLRPPSDG